MSYEYGNNGSYGGLGGFWNGPSFMGSYEHGTLGAYGGLENYWGFGNGKKGKGGGGGPKAPKAPKSAPKAPPRFKDLVKKIDKKMNKLPAAEGAIFAEKMMAKLPPKAVAKLQAAGVLPGEAEDSSFLPPAAAPVVPTDGTMPAESASPDAQAEIPVTTVAPTLYPAPGMLMQPGMLPQRGMMKPSAMPESRTITPQQARIAQIAAGLAAGLLFL